MRLPAIREPQAFISSFIASRETKPQPQNSFLLLRLVSSSTFLLPSRFLRFSRFQPISLLPNEAKLVQLLLSFQLECSFPKKEILIIYPPIQLRLSFATDAKVSVVCMVFPQLTEHGFPIRVMLVPDEAELVQNLLSFWSKFSFPDALIHCPCVQLRLSFATDVEVSGVCVVFPQLTEHGFPISVMYFPDEAKLVQLLLSFWLECSFAKALRLR